jgi:hypothetical protein
MLNLLCVINPVLFRSMSVCNMLNTSRMLERERERERERASLLVYAPVLLTGALINYFQKTKRYHLIYYVGCYCCLLRAVVVCVDLLGYSEKRLLCSCVGVCQPLCL